MHNNVETKHERQSESLVQSINRIKAASAEHLCEDAHAAPGALLPDQEHLVFVTVIDSQLGHRMGCLSDNLVLAYTPSVSEELFLVILADPLFDDQVVGVMLYKAERVSFLSIG